MCQRFSYRYHATIFHRGVCKYVCYRAPHLPQLTCYSCPSRPCFQNCFRPWGPEELCQALEDVIFYLVKSHPTPIFLPHIAFAQPPHKSRARFCASSILQHTDHQPAMTKVQPEYQAMGRKTQGILSILRVTKAQYKGFFNHPLNVC